MSLHSKQCNVSPAYVQFKIYPTIYLHCTQRHGLEVSRINLQVGQLVHPSASRVTIVTALGSPPPPPGRPALQCFLYE